MTHMLYHTHLSKVDVSLVVHGWINEWMDEQKSEIVESSINVLINEEINDGLSNKWLLFMDIYKQMIDYILL